MSEVVPEGWDNLKLGDLTSVITKGTTPKSYCSKGVNFVKVESVSNNATLIPSKFAHINLATHDNQKRSQLEDGDILFSIAGSLGRLALVMKQHLPANTNQALAIIRLIKESIDTGFCIQQLNGEAVQLELKNLQTVGAQPNLSLQQVSNILLSTPPLPEQQKIATILTSVDEVIEKTEEQISKLQDLKKGMMQELLTNGIGHTEFKDSPVGRVPKGWGINVLSKVVDVIDSLHSTPTFSAEGYPMVRVSDIKIGKIKLDATKRVDAEVFKQFIGKYQPKIDDVLMSRVGSYGVCSYVDTNKEFCIGQNTVVINPQSIDSKFLYYQLCSSLTQNQIENEVAGSGYKSLSLASIRNLVTVLPCKDEQERIGKILWSMDDVIERKQRKLSNNKNIKKALMQYLLTGKVRVNG